MFEAASASSLGTLTFGFALADIWRLTMGLIPFWTDMDRGRFLEAQWDHNAAARDEDSVGMGDLTQPVLDGRIPAPILNTSVVESGNRIMITPRPPPDGWRLL